MNHCLIASKKVFFVAVVFDAMITICITTALLQMP